MKRSCPAAVRAEALLAPLLCCACAAAARLPGGTKGGAFLAGPVVDGGGDATNYARLEAQNKDEFVRRCSMAMTARDERLVPWRQVDELCASTDRVTECQEEIMERFKLARMTGRSMSPVCEAAYGWFQDRYGMLCPNQCHKLQCRPTCQWLEAKKRLDRTEAELAAKRGLRGRREREVLELRELVEQKGKDAEVLHKKAARARIEAAKANASLVELAEAVTKAQAEEATARNATIPHEAELRELKDLLANASDSEAEQQRNVSTKELEAKLQGSRVRRLQEELAEAVTGMQKKQQLVQEIEMKLKQQNSTEKILEQQIDAVTKRMEEPNATVSRAEADLERAKRTWAEAEANGTGGALLEDLVLQKREVLGAARRALASVQRELNQAITSLEQSQLEARQAEKEKEEVLGKVEVANASRAALEVKVAEEQNETGKFVARVQAADQGLKKARAVVAERDLALKNKESTLKPFYDVILEKQERAERAAQALAAARRAAALKQFGYQQEEAEAEKLEEERRLLLEQLQELERTGLEAGNALDGQLAEHRSAVEDLQRWKPEVARQHGLGLLELLGY